MPFLSISILVFFIFNWFLTIPDQKRKVKNTDNGDSDDDDDGRDTLWPKDFNDLCSIFHFYNKSVRLTLLVSFSRGKNKTLDGLNKLPKVV